MKKLLPILAALAFCAGAQATTISGTVTSVATCNPVSGQVVYFSDTMMTWMDSAVTNSSGAYSITIPGSVTTTHVQAWANACGAQHRSGWKAVSSNININFITCGTPVVLNGRVRLNGTPTSGPAMVWLIRRDVAPVTFDTTLTAIDSMQTIGLGQFTFQYACTPPGVLLLKGALLPSHPNYSSYLPAYRDSSLNWNGANPLTTGHFTLGTWAYVDPKAGTNPGGPGFIGGSVLLGANKSAGVGDPLSGRTLILTTAAGKAVAYTTSDAAGKFQFSNLAIGSYKLFGDVWGKYDPALTVNITASKTSINNIIFEENDKKFEGRIGDLGMGRTPGLPGVSVFPNPATDFVSVAGLDAIQGDKLITLRDITGQLVSRQTITTGAASVSMAALPAGVYMLQVSTEAGAASFQVVK